MEEIAIYKLNDSDYGFPDPRAFPKEGLCAWGGDLSPGRVLEAYKRGIFPWFNEDDPLLWWSPDPRLILFPDKIKISKSLKKSLKKFDIKCDSAFESVMQKCQSIRVDNHEPSWIDERIIKSYCKLHKEGYAHSVETYLDGELVGGLYGILIGRVFCGESMFSLKADSSKAALVALCSSPLKDMLDFIDCQIPSDHLISMGAQKISRDEFLKMLDVSLATNHRVGKWTYFSKKQ